MARILTNALLLLACVWLSHVTFCNAASHDAPCDPYAPSDPCAVCDPDDPICDPFLECRPLFNQHNNGTCRCPNGLFWNPFDGGCRAEADGPCSVEADAAPCTRNSACDPATLRCACAEGFYPIATGSYCVAGHDAVCGNVTTEWAQCDHSIRLVCGGDDPDRRVCFCSGEYLWSDTRRKCLSTVLSTTSCAVDDDCVDNALCNDAQIRRCQCAPGFSRNADKACSLAYESTCDPAAGDGGLTCNELEYLTCNATTSTCLCPGARVPDPTAGRCLGLAGDACDQPYDCASPAECHVLVKQCICSLLNSFIQLPDRSCGRLGRAGGYCRVDGHDCSRLEYLECGPANDDELTAAGIGICTCPEGMTADANGRCILPLGAACNGDTNHNCVPNAVCNANGICACLPGSHQAADGDDDGTGLGRCVFGHGQQCNVSPNGPNPCNTAFGLSCVQNQCSCPAGQEWDDIRQHCVALVSGNCNVTEPYCTAHASCTSRGVCECVAGYSQHTPEDRRCRASHGRQCDQQTPCNTQQFLICSAGTCACEFPLQQVWQVSNGGLPSSCVSVLGGHCGDALEEYGNRTSRCIASTICRLDENLVQKCMCDEEAGWVPDGEGGCRPPGEETTTTTTTQATPTTSPTPTTTTVTVPTTITTTAATTTTEATTTTQAATTTTPSTTTTTTPTTTTIQTTTSNPTTTTETSQEDEDNAGLAAGGLRAGTSALLAILVGFWLVL